MIADEADKRVLLTALRDKAIANYERAPAHDRQDFAHVVDVVTGLLEDFDRYSLLMKQVAAEEDLQLRRWHAQRKAAYKARARMAAE